MMCSKQGIQQRLARTAQELAQQAGARGAWRSRQAPRVPEQVQYKTFPFEIHRGTTRL